MAHKGARNDLSAEYVRSLLDYDPDTGVLTRKHSRRGDMIGKPAGSITNKGHIIVSIGPRHYLAHRLIWLMRTDKWPPEEIDHIDRDPTNNRWNNLRLASSSQNCVNKRSSRPNTSGFTGVYFHKKAGRYMAYIRYQKHYEYLGLFDTAKEANIVRQARAKELFGEFYHVNALQRP